MVEGYDGRTVDIRDQLNITGPHLNPAGISSEVLSVAVSHLHMIYRWYTETDEKIGFFCEDDINFSLVDHWNFDIDEFVERLPNDWQVMQMSLIKEDPVNRSDMRIRRKRWNDWSCCAYMMRREYAKEILDDFYDEETNTYNLKIKETKHIHLPDNVF